jgi:hypothetical protein
MTKDGNDSDGLGEAHPALWVSHLTNADEGRIRAECFIPNFIKIRFDMESQVLWPVQTPTRSVYTRPCSRPDFRLPFIPIVRELLGFLDLSPHQLSPNTWRTFFGCVVLWPLALGKQHQLTVTEFMHIYRIQKNPYSSGVFNFQTKRGKFIQIDSQFSSNPKWKNRYFFVSGSGSLLPKRKQQGPRVPREINDPSNKAYQEPIMTPEMTKRVNDVIAWSQDHGKMMFVGSLVTAPKLSEFVYDVESFRAPMRPIGDPLRARPDPSGPAANTRGSTPLKGKNKVPVAVQSKPKIVDKGKAKVVDTGKPKKVTYPIQTGGAFKIHERKVPTPPALPIAPLVKKSPVVEKKVEKPSKVARVLKLLDEEEGSEAGEPAKALPKPVLEVHAHRRGVGQSYRGPPLKKRKLKKVAEPEVPIVEPAAPGLRW